MFVCIQAHNIYASGSIYLIFTLIMLFFCVFFHLMLLLLFLLRLLSRTHKKVCIFTQMFSILWTHTHTYTKRHAAVRKGIRFGIYLQFEYTHQLEAHSHILNEIRFYDKLIGSLLILSKMHWNNQRIPCRVIRWHTHTTKTHLHYHMPLNLTTREN